MCRTSLLGKFRCNSRNPTIAVLDSKFHSLCEPAHSVSATQLFGDNLNAELKELDDSKKVHVSIAKKRGVFSSRKERTDMIRNILHRRIFVGGSQKITNLFKGKA